MITTSPMKLAKDYMKSENKTLCCSVFTSTDTFQRLLITVIYRLLLEIDTGWFLLTSLSFPFFCLLREHMAPRK